MGIQLSRLCDFNPLFLWEQSWSHIFSIYNLVVALPNFFQNLITICLPSPIEFIILHNLVVPLPNFFQNLITKGTITPSPIAPNKPIAMKHQSRTSTLGLTMNWDNSKNSSELNSTINSLNLVYELNELNLSWKLSS